MSNSYKRIPESQILEKNVFWNMTFWGSIIIPLGSLTPEFFFDLRQVKHLVLRHSLLRIYDSCSCMPRYGHIIHPKCMSNIWHDPNFVISNNIYITVWKALVKRFISYFKETASSPSFLSIYQGPLISPDGKREHPQYLTWPPFFNQSKTLKSKKYCLNYS